jgi:hypothetical protein
LTVSPGKNINKKTDAKIARITTNKDHFKYLFIQKSQNNNVLSPIKMFAIINRKQKTNFGTKPWSIRDDGQAEALDKSLYTTNQLLNNEKNNPNIVNIHNLTFYIWMHYKS